MESGKAYLGGGDRAPGRDVSEEEVQTDATCSGEVVKGTEQEQAWEPILPKDIQTALV